MLVAENRPRNLDWKHAGPLLFGDWGTSRLYVLGLAFYYTSHASIYYLAVMSLIMAGVAWGYTIVCRCFPDGGGVYSSARRLSPILSVIGATLLLCDFIVTAALSAVEGFHYLGVESQKFVVIASIVTIAVLGFVNWLGARAAGRLALIIAVLAIIASAIIGVLCFPMLGEGLRHATAKVEGVETIGKQWESLVRIVLALSGVEAVASMSGLMKPPVEKTAKKTIWPVLVEVIVLNVIFCLAINALPGRVTTTLPDYVRYEERMKLPSDLAPPEGATPELTKQLDEVKEYRQTAVKILAEHSATRAMGARTGKVFGTISGVIFGLLLLSAVNTAIMAMVSVFYSLAQDGEIPRQLKKLNYSGVPWIGLILACVMPAVVLVFVHDDKALGELYAIGVVGAIAINFVCCAWNKELPIRPLERKAMWFLAALMTVIELTIIVKKPHATLFAGSVVAAVLLARFFVRRAAAKKAVPVPTSDALPTPAEGWLEALRDDPKKLLGTPGPRIMLAARGRDNAEFAVDMAKKRGAALFAIYVRTLRVLDVAPGQVPKLADDVLAQETLGTTAVIAKKAGVPFVPIYVTSPNIAEEILDYTVTFGCDTVVMGKSRRGAVARTVAGDVLAEVAKTLPDGVALITRGDEGGKQA